VPGGIERQLIATCSASLPLAALFQYSVSVPTYSGVRLISPLSRALEIRSRVRSPFLISAVKPAFLRTPMYMLARISLSPKLAAPTTIFLLLSTVAGAELLDSAELSDGLAAALDEVSAGLDDVSAADDEAALAEVDAAEVEVDELEDDELFDLPPHPARRATARSTVTALVIPAPSMF